ncbi:hypothetical protein ANO11243_093720 [Dothideomycetidae sp. 11243]|nr:hypothetical protein ANO11243_093720 [fungal sp. No.11243]
MKLLSFSAALLASALTVSATEHVHLLTPSCRCILRAHDWPIPPEGSGDAKTAHKVPSLSSVKCDKEYTAGIKKAFHYPKQFCRYMEKLDRTDRPIASLSVLQVMQGCKCILPKKMTTTTTTTTKKRRKHSAVTLASATATSDTISEQGSDSPAATTTASPSEAGTTTTTITTTASSSVPTSPTVSPTPTCPATLNSTFVIDQVSMTLSTTTTNGSFIPTPHEPASVLYIPFAEYDVALSSCVEVAVHNVSQGYETLVILNLNDTSATWECSVQQAYSLYPYAEGDGDIACSYYMIADTGKAPL